MQPLLRSSHRFFHRHPGQLALAVIGLAAGVAVVTGVALMRDVLVQSLDQAGEALAGRDSLRIEHPSGKLDETLVADLATQRGAPALVPVLTERLRIGGDHFELLATDPIASLNSGPSTVTTGEIGELIQSANGVAVNRATLEQLGAEPGEAITVESGGREHRLVIATVFAGTGALDGRLLMDIAAAQDLLGRTGEIDYIEAPAHAAGWLARHLDDSLVIAPAEQRRESAARLTAGMRANLTAMSLISLAVGLFVIYSVLSFLLVQRRRSFGILRAVGVTPGRIRGLLIVETLFIAGFGALIGLILGTLLADGLLQLVRQPLAELYRLLPPAEVNPSPALYIVVWSGSVALAVASTAALWREVDRIPPGQLARSRQVTAHRRWLPAAAVALLAGGAATAVLTNGLTGALIGLFVGLFGFALLAPEIGMRIISLLSAPGRRRLPGRSLAMLAAGRSRIAPAISALSLALALSAGIGMMVLGFRVAVDDWVDRFLRADVYLSLSQGTIDKSLFERIGQLDGVAELSSVRRTRLPDGRNLIAYDLPDAAWDGFEWLQGGGNEVREAFRAGQAVVVSEPYARRHDVGPGDRLVLHSPEGALELPVAGIYRDYASDQGSIAIHAPFYRERWQDPVRDSLGLYLESGPAEELDPLRERLRSIDDNIRLTTRSQVRDRTMA
ncbi:MAG: FtsX-like permease family protein, partial [Wenzhouxiangella sp.]